MCVLWWIRGEQHRDLPEQLCATHHVAPPCSSLGWGSQTVPETPVDPCSQPGGEDNVPGPRHALPKTMRLVQTSWKMRVSPLPLAPPPPHPLCSVQLLTPLPSVAPPILSAHLSCDTTSQPALGPAPSLGALSGQKEAAILRHRVGAEQQLDPGLKQDGCPDRGCPGPPQPHP